MRRSLTLAWFAATLVDPRHNSGSKQGVDSCVTVTATNVETGAKLTTTSNDAGVYRFPTMLPGKYSMTALLPGFNPTTINSLNIGDMEVLQDLTLEFPTQPASATPTASSCGGNGIA